jgi:hypothetical protein
MFVIKLYRDGGRLRRIVEAEAIDLSPDLDGSTPSGIQRLVFTKGKNDGRTVDTYYVGPSDPSYLPQITIFLYDRAIVETAAGRTTEIFNAPRRELRRAVPS